MSAGLPLVFPLLFLHGYALLTILRAFATLLAEWRERREGDLDETEGSK